MEFYHHQLAAQPPHHHPDLPEAALARRQYMKTRYIDLNGNSQEHTEHFEQATKAGPWQICREIRRTMPHYLSVSADYVAWRVDKTCWDFWFEKEPYPFVEPSHHGLPESQTFKDLIARERSAVFSGATTAPAQTAQPVQPVQLPATALTPPSYQVLPAQQNASQQHGSTVSQYQNPGAYLQANQAHSQGQQGPLFSQPTQFGQMQQVPLYSQSIEARQVHQAPVYSQTLQTTHDQQAPHTTPCAKCSRTGHTLATCIGPPRKVYGDIHGCPHCNSVMHLFDQCSAVKGGDGVEPMSRRDKFKFLIHYRQDKPLIRSDEVFSREELNQFAAQYGTRSKPWTRSFAMELLRQGTFNFRDYDYDTKLPTLPVDPISTVQFSQAWQQSFSWWGDKLRKDRNQRLAWLAPPGHPLALTAPVRPAAANSLGGVTPVQHEPSAMQGGLVYQSTSAPRAQPVATGHDAVMTHEASPGNNHKNVDQRRSSCPVTPGQDADNMVADHNHEINTLNMVLLAYDSRIELLRRQLVVERQETADLEAEASPKQD